MAKKSNQEDVIVNVDELYSKSEQFVDKNRKQLTMGLGGAAAIILVVIGYSSLVVAPKNTAAEEAAFMAEHYFAKDSSDLAMFGDGLNAGLEEIINDYSGTPAAARPAAFEMGIMHRDAADFEAAVEAFNQAGFNDDVFGMTDANIGDCLVELGDLEGAEEHFASAASRAASGLAAKALSPMCSYKQALVLLELGEDDKARDVWKISLKIFPTPPTLQCHWTGCITCTLIHGNREQSEYIRERRLAQRCPLSGGHCCV